MKIRRVDHVGIIVNDLPAAKTFFLNFGLELMGEAPVEGEWVGRVIGLHDVKATVVMMRTSDGETNVELAKFDQPSSEKNAPLPQTPWASATSPSSSKTSKPSSPN